MSNLDFAAIMQAGQNLIPDISDEMRKRLLNQQAELELKALSQSQSDEANFATDARVLWDNPTPQAFARMQALYPKHAAQLKTSFETMEGGQRQRTITTLGSALSRARVGDWDAATKILRPWHDSEVAAGQADPSEIEVMRVIESGTPEERAGIGGLIMAQLAAAVGPDKIGTFWSELHGEERAQAKHPLEVSQQQSEATTKAAEAEVAPAYYGARAQQEQADAAVAQNNSLWQDAKNSLAVAGSKARVSNILSIIRRRAADLGKRPEEVTEDDLLPPLKAKKRIAGGLSKRERQTEDFVEGRDGKDVTAVDANGNRVHFNRRTKQWEAAR